MNGALFGVAIRGGEANELSRTLFSEHGIVLRPFNTQGLNAVRLSPNLFNTEGEIDRFFDAL
jgi:selenocysteine lyase/cysteine desulfurase